MSVLTEKQAYAAVFQFLDSQYELVKSDVLGNLLSEMSLLSDGGTADPAMAYHWRKAVGRVLNLGEAADLERTMTEQQVCAAMLEFLNTPYIFTDPDEMVGLLGTVSVLADGLPADPAISGYWRKAFEYAVNGGEAGKLVLGKR
jgi:hypothetical protein